MLHFKQLEYLGDYGVRLGNRPDGKKWHLASGFIVTKSTLVTGYTFSFYNLQKNPLVYHVICFMPIN